MMWPFKKAEPGEDWRYTGEERWATGETAGDYEQQHLEAKVVRFPDGATKWVRRRSSVYFPRTVFRIAKRAEKV